MKSLRSLFVVIGAVIAFGALGAGLAFALDGDGEAAGSPNDEAIALQNEMREDLSHRLGVDTDQIEVVSFRFVTWGDGCLGGHRSGSDLHPGAGRRLARRLGRARRRDLPLPQRRRRRSSPSDFEDGVVGVADPVA